MKSYSIIKSLLLFIVNDQIKIFYSVSRYLNFKIDIAMAKYYKNLGGIKYITIFFSFLF